MKPTTIVNALWVVLIILILLFWVLATVTGLPMKNGQHFGCSNNTTMDISYHLENDPTVLYQCGDPENTFTVEYTIPNDAHLLRILRSIYTQTNTITGVILDANGNLVQLYQVKPFIGVKIDWNAIK